MRTLSYETWNAIPSIYREYRGGRYHILLAGKMRPVMLRMPMMPLIGAPAITAVTERPWTAADTQAAV
jgi:hypothetical protein